jgi:PhnB protein
MEFYRSFFGGEFQTFRTFGEARDDMPVDASTRDLVMHSSLEVDGSMLMASDQGAGDPLQIGNNFSIALAPQSRGRCDELFARLADGGTVTMPLQETFWGAYFGSLRDRFGIGWMLNHELSPPG